MKLVFCVSVVGPVLTIIVLSLGCGAKDKKNSDWWLQLGSFHFNMFISVASIFLVFLVIILSMTWFVLWKVRDSSGPDSLKNTVLLENIGTMKRLMAVTGALLVYLVISVVYVNISSAYSIMAEYAFAFASAGLG